MIWEELKQTLVIPGMKAESIEDVMKQLGYLLIQEGYAKESYVDALIAREKDYPTGLDIDGIGVAIPHTDVSHVLEGGLAVATLERPVTFTQMGTDDEFTEVRVVFMLAVIKPQEHIDRLQNILAIIQDTEVLKKLIAAEDKQQIINIIKEKEYEIVGGKEDSAACACGA